MPSVPPPLMRRSDQLAGWFSRHLPKYLTFGGELVKRTLRTFVLPASLPLYRHSRVFVLSLFSYVVFLIVLAITTGWWHLGAALALPAAVYGMWRVCPLNV